MIATAWRVRPDGVAVVGAVVAGVVASVALVAGMRLVGYSSESPWFLIGCAVWAAVAAFVSAIRNGARIRNPSRLPVRAVLRAAIEVTLIGYGGVWLYMGVGTLVEAPPWILLWVTIGLLNCVVLAAFAFPFVVVGSFAWSWWVRARALGSSPPGA